jgi:hypothetical protein
MTLIERWKAAAIAEHPDEAICLNCGFPISSHDEFEPAGYMRTRPLPALHRICPTSTFTVSIDSINDAIKAARSER